jgi:hypothetical protein
MPNTPKKIKDPTEAALSAIQDVLSIRDEVTPEPQPNTAPAIETQPEAPVLDDASFEPPWRQTDAAPEVDIEKSGIPLVDDGNAIEWGDGTIDMSAELIEDIASQTMRPQDFAEFLERNKLTQEAARRTSRLQPTKNRILPYYWAYPARCSPCLLRVRSTQQRL